MVSPNSASLVLGSWTVKSLACKVEVRSLDKGLS